MKPMCPSRLSLQWLCGRAAHHLGTAVHHVPKCMSGHKAIVVMGGHIVFMIAYILSSSCFCEILTLYVLWITYDYLYIYIYI